MSVRQTVSNPSPQEMPRLLTRRSLDRTSRTADNQQIAWDANEGAALEESLTVDKELGAAPVRLVCARFLINLAKAGGRLVRRQDLPEAAFISLHKLKQMGCGYMQSDLRILCLSHMWLTPDHPDPRGDNLRAIAEVLETFVNDRFSGGTWAVFLDYASLPQLGCRGEARGPAEELLLSRGLQSLASLYSHPCTWTLKLTKLPADYPHAFGLAHGTVPNTASYDDRGWCWTEASVSNLVKPYTQVLDLSRYTGGDLDTLTRTTIRRSNLRVAFATSLPELIRVCRAGRAPPLTPDDFDRRLESKAFTWREADLPTVRRLYRSAFEQRFAQARTLSYLDLGWGDDDACTLCKVIESGALRYTTRLELTGNHFGDEGMRRLAHSIACDEAVPLLEVLHLHPCDASDEAVAAVERALRESQQRSRARAAAAAGGDVSADPAAARV